MTTRGHRSRPAAASWARSRRSPGRDVRVRDDLEAESLVIRAVPRHVSVRGQRQCLDAVLSSPTYRGLNQRSAQTLSGSTWMDRDLLDMRAGVNHLHQQVRHRLICVIGGHPRSASGLEDGEGGGRERLVVGDRVHAKLAEDRPGRALELPQLFQLVTACRPGSRLDAAIAGLSGAPPLTKRWGTRTGRLSPCADFCSQASMGMRRLRGVPWVGMGSRGSASARGQAGVTMLSPTS